MPGSAIGAKGDRGPLRGGELLRELGRPLPFARALLWAILLVAAATGYCSLYCAIAFHPMHAMPMPFGVSLAWAVTTVVPWLGCFELGKRRLRVGHGGWHRAVLVASFAAAAGLSILSERVLDQAIGFGETRAVSFQLADQLPAALITGALLFLSARLSLEDRADASAGERRSALEAILAGADRIDWIRSAGNYVEIHIGGRAEMHRLTMRDLERALKAQGFLRIHRSMIVNRDRVERLVGADSLFLKDGTVLKIGDRYKGGVAATLG